ncbi:MAG: hypothetical protein WCF90_01395 [Methanomicrobiales archaeon]
MSVPNPRLGDITDALSIHQASGIEVSPAEYFIGTRNAGESVQVPFELTPNQQP